MAQDKSVSIQGVAIRVSRLTASGAVASGPLASYVMKSFISAQFTPEYEDGENITEKTASGETCVDYQAPSTLKRVTLELSICEPDPEFTELVAGGAILATTTGTATTLQASSAVGATTLSLSSNSGVGFFNLDTAANLEVVQIVQVTGSTAPFTATLASPATKAHASAVSLSPVPVSSGYAPAAVGVDANPNGVGLEIWSYAVQGGRRAANNPYFKWVFPLVQLRPTGDRVIENGLMANVFSGYGDSNALFGTGPALDWPFPTNRPYQYARTSVAPTGVNGYVAVA